MSSETLTIRVSAETLAWLKARGQDYGNPPIAPEAVAANILERTAQRQTMFDREFEQERERRDTSK